MNIRLAVLLWFLTVGVGAAQNRDPTAAQVVTEDIGRFWIAYDQALPDLRAEPFRDLYLVPGSSGLRDFTLDNIGSAEELAATVRTFPNYYRTIRPQTLQVRQLEPTVRRSFLEFAALYPEAVFPDVFFVIGAFRSGGTTSKNGLIIGTEFFSVGPDTLLGELGPWERGSVRSIETLPTIVIHELVHFQQNYRQANLLYQAIIEGSADFIAELVTGELTNEHIYAYGDENEKALWQAFSRIMYGTDTSDWLYNGSNAKARPADLGYWMGYKIVKAYYDQAADKKKAVAEIIQLEDATAFLKSSNYADSFQ